MLSAATQRTVFDRYLTVPEETQLMRYIAMRGDAIAQRDQAWMTLMRQTGLRVQSLARFTCADARQALRDNHLTLRDEITKGAHGYQVFLNRKARAALKDLLRLRRAQRSETSDEPLVISRLGKGMSVRNYQDRMAKWVKRAGLTVHASPHWLRHTLAKRIMCTSESRDPQGIVQAALGHRCRESTVVYTLPDRDDLRDAMESAQ